MYMKTNLGKTPVNFKRIGRHGANPLSLCILDENKMIGCLKKGKQQESRGLFVTHSQFEEQSQVEIRIKWIR